MEQGRCNSRIYNPHIHSRVSASSFRDAASGTEQLLSHAVKIVLSEMD